MLQLLPTPAVRGASNQPGQSSDVAAAQCTWTRPPLRQAQRSFGKSGGTQPVSAEGLHCGLPHRTAHPSLTGWETPPRHAYSGLPPSTCCHGNHCQGRLPDHVLVWRSPSHWREVPAMSCEVLLLLCAAGVGARCSGLLRHLVGGAERV